MTQPGAQTPVRHPLAHRLAVMSGRDPHEQHRTATPLELLFDLTFVVAFGQAANQLAHLLAEGHLASGLTGFGFATFAITWAWINYSWFASAYDTDDWAFRVLTMVQMLGVLVLALGLPQMFGSIDEGAYLDNGVMVLGYVVMRVAMVAQWLRAARQDPNRRDACMTYVTAVILAQVGWVVLILLRQSVLVAFLCAIALTGVEMLGPYLAQTRKGGTPWHAHHIAERYGLLAIIALGEGVIGTVASLAAVIEHQGWTLDVALVGIAGTGLTFGMWWVYFIVPSGKVLHARRERAFRWGYGHIPLYGAIVATGAGLHVAAYYIEGEAHIGAVAVLLTVAVPVAVYLLMVYLLYTAILGEVDPFHAWLLAGTGVVLVLSVLMAAAGVPLTVCLVVLSLAPVVTVVGYEALGHEHQLEALRRQVGKRETS